jgi:hypothetical protein
MDLAAHVRTVEEVARDQEFERQVIEQAAGDPQVERLMRQWRPIYPRSAILTITPGEEQRPPTATAEKEECLIDKETIAIALLVKHPDWTVTQIAKAAGANRTSLYRFPMFMNALKLCQGAAQREFLDSIPRGARTADRHNKREPAEIDAWEPRKKEDEE